MRTRISLLACGGTVAGTADPDGRYQPGRQAAELLRGVDVPAEVEAIPADVLMYRAE